MPARAKQLQSAAWLALVAATILVLYWRFLDAYLWDDDFAWIVAGRTFDPAWSFGFTQRTHFYRPLIELYFDIGVALFGYSTRAFHALNIALHILNAWLVFLIARRLLRTIAAAGAAALIFAVLPGILDTIAWVSAVTALLMATFYLSTLLLHLVWLQDGNRKAHVVSHVTFAAALLSHEGAVTLWPALILLDLFVAPRRPAVRQYIAFAVMLIAFLAIAFIVNRHNYVVSEGQYRVGLHVLRNLLDYVGVLYVARHGVIGLVTTAAVLLAVIAFGSRTARFASVWMLLALLPYSLFVQIGGGRYAYLAGAAFALLLVALLQSLQQTLRPDAGAVGTAGATLVVAAAVAIRFAVFAVHSVPVAVKAGERYRAWFIDFRRTHGALPRGAVVTVEDPHVPGVDTRGFLPLLQLEYGDPALQVEVRAARTDARQ
ncbi:MAG TPA: glycosyltransferase family 39 protein [Vicinamibacterales bacterium]|nr:glycosyltransferase family 39 protein [Vicinamibacterales bacterium]